MTKQDLVEIISHQTGISKRDLAGWIGTDPSVLCRYLAGTRSLPLSAVQQLLFLHQYLSDLPPLPTTLPTATDKEEWQQRAAECLSRWEALQAAHIAMQQRWKAATKLLQLLDVLAADTLMLTPRKERWIAEQRYQAEKVLEENNPAALKRLQVQIQLLQREAAICAGLAGATELSLLL